MFDPRVLNLVVDSLSPVSLALWIKFKSHHSHLCTQISKSHLSFNSSRCQINHLTVQSGGSHESPIKSKCKVHINSESNENQVNASKDIQNTNLLILSELKSLSRRMATMEEKSMVLFSRSQAFCQQSSHTQESDEDEDLILPSLPA